jgi:hypothetical protein
MTFEELVRRSRLVRGGTLVVRGGRWFKRPETERVGAEVLADVGELTLERLATEFAEGSESHYLEYVDKRPGDEGPGCGTGPAPPSQADLNSVPFYASVAALDENKGSNPHVIPPPGEGSYTISYAFLFSTNPAFSILGGLLYEGYHKGDIEHLSVVVKQGKVAHVYYSAHGSCEGQWRPRGRFEFFGAPGSERPVVFCARGSHACYAESGKKWRIFGFANDRCSRQGLVWDPVSGPGGVDGGGIVLTDYDAGGFFSRWKGCVGNDGVPTLCQRPWNGQGCGGRERCSKSVTGVKRFFYPVSERYIRDRPEEIARIYATP